MEEFVSAQAGGTNFDVKPLQHDPKIMQHLERHVEFRPNAPIRLDDPNMHYEPAAAPQQNTMQDIQQDLQQQQEQQQEQQQFQQQEQQQFQQQEQQQFQSYEQPQEEQQEPRWTHNPYNTTAIEEQAANDAVAQYNEPPVQGIGELTIEADQHGVQVGLTTAEAIPGGVRITKRLIRKHKIAHVPKCNPEEHEEELHMEHVLHAQRAAEVRHKATRVQHQRAQELRQRERAQRKLQAEIAQRKEQFEEEERQLQAIYEREARRAERALHRRVARERAEEKGRELPDLAAIAAAEADAARCNTEDELNRLDRQRAAHERRKIALVRHQRELEEQRQAHAHHKLHTVVHKKRTALEKEEHQLERIRAQEARKARRLLRRRVAKVKAAEEASKPRKRPSSHTKEATERRLEHRKDSRLRLKAKESAEAAAQRKAAAVRRAERRHDKALARVEQQKWRAAAQERARETRDARLLARQQRKEARRKHHQVAVQLREDYDVVVLHEHDAAPAAEDEMYGQAQQPQTYNYESVSHEQAPSLPPQVQFGNELPTHEAHPDHVSEIQKAIAQLQHEGLPPQDSTAQPPAYEATQQAAFPSSLPEATAANYNPIQSQDERQLYEAQDRAIAEAMQKLGQPAGQAANYQLPSQDAHQPQINASQLPFSQNTAIDQAIQNITNTGRIN